MKTTLPFRYIFLLLLVAEFNCLFAANKGQNITVERYPITETRLFSQFWCVGQDSNGMMFFGGTLETGLMQFDGKDWRMVNNTYGKTIRSIATDSAGVVYVASELEIGFLDVDDKGEYYFHSFEPSLFSQSIKGIFWNVLCTPEGIFYFSQSDLVRYKKGKISQWKINGIAFAHKYKNSILFEDLKKGFLTVLDDSVAVVSSFENRKYYGNFILLPFGDSLILGARGKELQVLSHSTLKTAEKVSLKLQEANQIQFIYSGTVLSENRLALGGIGEDGLYMFDKNMNLTQRLTVKENLSSNIIYDVFQDKQENIWLGTEAGINKIVSYSPIENFSIKYSIEGAVICMEIVKNALYVGTSMGLYIINQEGISKVEGINSHVWEIIQVKQEEQNYIIVSTYQGIFRVQQDKAHLLFTTFNTSLIPAKFGSSAFYFLDDSFFGKIAMGNRKWSLHRFTQVSSSNTVIRFDFGTNDVWGFNFNQIVRYTISEDTAFEKTYYINNSPSIHVYNIQLYNDTVKATTSDGVYFYDSQKDIFVKDVGLLRAFQNNGNLVRWFNQTDSALWIMTINGNEWIPKKVTFNNEKYVLEDSPLPMYSSRVPCIDICQQSDSIVWLATKEGLLKYNLKVKIPNYRFNTLIRKVSIDNDSIIYMGDSPAILKKKNFVFDSRTKKIKFSFTSPNFIEEQHVKFSYFLEGTDKQWSMPSEESNVEYSNLALGSYTFKVKSFDFSGRDCGTATFSFSIQSPWYLSWWGIIVIMVLLLFSVYSIIWVYNYRLLVQKRILKNEVEKRTFELYRKNQMINRQNKELYNQNEEIQAQRDEIQAQRDNLQKLSIVASESSNAVMIILPNGIIEWVNNSFQKIYGYSLYELDKKFKLEFLRITSTPIKKQLFQECLDMKKTIIYESAFPSVTGQMIHTQSTMTPVLNDNQEVIKVIVIDTDLTKEKELENYKQLMTQMIVHDLKSPLNSIIGLSTIKPEEHKYFRAISSSGYQMLNLIQNILDVYKYQRQNIILDLNTYLVKEVVDAAISDAHKGVLYVKNIELSFMIPENFKLIFDFSLLSRVLLNLLNNAIKYTPADGKIKLIVSEYTENNRKYLLFVVSDTGIGIPSDQLNKVFDEYWQVEARNLGLTSSTGLGLTFSKMVVDAHNGRIWVESELDKGSDFKFILPM